MKRNVLYIFISCLLLSGGISAQVTIGSSIPPVEGALLDLKEKTSDNASTTNKGLGLPRVNLAGNNRLLPMLQDVQEYVDDPENSVENSNHVGLMVYNTNKITNNKESRLCPGIHVWDGKRWNPIQKYPSAEDAIKEKQATLDNGRKADLVDIRNGGSEQNTYTSAKFISAYVANPYSCDPLQVLVSNAGIWMTVNLRTEYFTDGEHITEQSSETISSFAIPVFKKPTLGTAGNLPETEENRKQVGLEYNWAAATQRRGGVDGTDFYNITETNIDIIPPVKGICPEGWHLPSAKEWKELDFTIKVHPQLYSTETEPVYSNGYSGSSSHLRLPKGLADPQYVGTAYSAQEGGFAALAYEAKAAKWSTSASSSGTAELPRHIYALASGNISTIGRFSVPITNRSSIYNVRCKKDTDQ